MKGTIDRHITRHSIRYIGSGIDKPTFIGITKYNFETIFGISKDVIERHNEISNFIGIYSGIDEHTNLSIDTINFGISFVGIETIGIDISFVGTNFSFIEYKLGVSEEGNETGNKSYGKFDGNISRTYCSDISNHIDII